MSSSQQRKLEAALTGGSTVHYRCTFDLRPEATSVAWSDLPKLVRTWIGSKAPELSIAPQWFLEGGRVEARGNRRLAVATAREAGTGTAGAPQFWSARFDHPCSEVASRQWRTDVGLTRSDDRVRFSLLTRHWIRDGYIGEEPRAPVPSAPGLVGRLLRTKHWQAFVGPQRLSDAPVALPAGQGVALHKLLGSPDRLSTVVLVSREFGTEKTFVDPPKLARLLAGVATVMVAESAEVNKELEWVLPRLFRCWNGMVRVYLPGLRFDHEPDARRHRYFYGDQIESMTPHELEAMLVTGIARRSGFQPTDALTTLEDVAARERERRLMDLRRAVDDTTLREFAELLEKDNEGLRGQVRFKDEELRTAYELGEDALAQNETLVTDMAGIANERDYWKKTALSAQTTIQRLTDGAENLAGLQELPTTLPAAIRAIEALHGGKVVFTPRALKSAENATSYDLSEVWRCLWGVATLLPSLFFGGGKVPDVEDVFRAQTGFPLALSEGGSTKNDRRLMKLRKDRYEGVEIDITPHIKLGADFRVHFFVDRDHERIIVGHCGAHLDTAGTRRMS